MCVFLCYTISSVSLHARGQMLGNVKASVESLKMLFVCHLVGYEVLPKSPKFEIFSNFLRVPRPELGYKAPSQLFLPNRNAWSP